MNKLKKNLVLTGMMGSGKSTIGKLLSKELRMEFVDTDNIIEKKLSLSIEEIFESKGEQFFRKIEEEEIKIVLQKSSLIIALGGGSFANKTIREHVKKTSISVWLDLDVNLIYKRAGNNKKRPLLKNISEIKLKKLYEERKKTYSLADFRVNSNSKDKDRIVKAIKKIYENR